jgi:hypothetical protein
MGEYLKKSRFDCQPMPGPTPGLGNCINERPMSVCSFGSARPVLRESFELCESLSKDAAESSSHPTEPDKDALSLEQEGIYFLSDSTTGAVFYFVTRGRQWSLIAIDNSDCATEHQSP